MKITIDKNIFLDKIILASHFTATRFSSLSTLQGILVKSEAGNINLYSTNLNSYYCTKIKTKINGPFQFVIEPKKIIEFLSLLSAGEIDVEIREKQLLIFQKKIKGSFPLLSFADFPLPPKVKEKEQKIKTEFLLKTLPLVLFSVSTDTARPVLTSVNFLTQEEDMIMVSTDGFRLSFMKTKKEIDFSSMLVPSDFLNEILRFIKGEKEILFSYSKEEKMVVFSLGEDRFFSRLIDGDYPPFEKVIPTEIKTKVILEKEEFLKNIKLISVFAQDHSNVVVINITKKGVYFHPKTEKDEENETYQEAEIEGEEQKVAFNFKFIIDLLNHVDAKKITLEILRADTPAMFKLDNDLNFFHIIMPVRIQDEDKT